ncbi:MAG: DUF389 domain-containing protein, partial [Gemmatimonadetes bacterium]|nr:DUF389 domain-containing protein [Gemmatimonadota bacterium]
MTSATGSPPEQEPAGGISEPEMVQRSFRVFVRGVRRFLNRTLDIRDDANIDGTIETIHKDMVFRGPNVWVLVCSIFIASIGLNTNSAAVIIGAMLISPLMGPILAIGLSVGMNDIDVLRRAVRNFAVMVAVALFTSTLYFLITPLGDVQSELLARTRPTLLDALIAVFGGIAGIIGVSRRDRGNVIPGVAIATALMPPLCTAGYGLANGNWPFFFGAIYLFALNSIFIAISTVMIVRFLHFPFVKFIDAQARRRVRIRIAVFVAVVLLPSAWVLYGVVRESLWRARAAEFVTQNILNLPGVDVINQRMEYADSLSRIEVFLAGDTVPRFLEEQLQTRMAQAGLGNTSLRLHQPQDIRGELGRLSSELRVGIVQDLYERNALALAERDQRIRELEGRLLLFERDTIPLAQITREIATQYPAIERIAFGRVIEMRESPPEAAPDPFLPDSARADSTVVPLAPPRMQDTIPTFMVR